MNHQTAGRRPADSKGGIPASTTSPITVPAAAVKGRQRRAARRREAMICKVSLLIPDERRTYYHYLARCPACGQPHLGQSRDLPGVTVTRRLPCKQWITIMVARSYGATA